MASSRKSKPSNSASTDLAARVAARLKTVVKPGDRLLLGLSGGIDSMVLLDVLARFAKRGRFQLEALHVNHQLSPNAARWARFCRVACTERGLACRVVKVRVGRGNSVEGAARDARYAALHAADVDYVVLAHNSDDQAETVLLQLLRGAGVKGLAAMPFLRTGARAERSAQDGMRVPHSASLISHPSSLIPHASVMRPLLETSRMEIERYARRRKLTWIDDESNTNTTYQRNWLRHEVLPLIAARVPGYRATLTRAAHHFAEAAVLLDDLARDDAGTALASGTISVLHLQSLSAARAKNVLRLMIAARGWRMPDAERLQEALRQVRMARADAQLRVDLGGYELRRHRDTLYLLAAQLEPTRRVVTWHGERELLLPDFGGLLAMVPRTGRGIRARHLRAAPVTIRAREGGERLQCHANRPRRTVKNLLQEARMPPWERERIPFIYCGDILVCVPGLGVDHRYQAAYGEAAISPIWRVL
jgi:tRNA(Ile)-lysidine synthase